LHAGQVGQDSKGLNVIKDGVFPKVDFTKRYASSKKAFDTALTLSVNGQPNETNQDSKPRDGKAACNA
jgi:hypothetical protein